MGRPKKETAETPSGFDYLSPWLPCSTGWWCLGHRNHRLWRWRFLREHTETPEGQRFVVWHLFEDYSRTPETLQRADVWTTPPVLLGHPTDLTAATDVVALRWAAYREGKVPA